MVEEECSDSNKGRHIRNNNKRMIIFINWCFVTVKYNFGRNTFLFCCENVQFWFDRLKKREIRINTVVVECVGDALVCVTIEIIDGKCWLVEDVLIKIL